MKREIKQVLFLALLFCIGILIFHRMGYFDKELETYETEKTGEPFEQGRVIEQDRLIHVSAVLYNESIDVGDTLLLIIKDDSTYTWKGKNGLTYTRRHRYESSFHGYLDNSQE